MHENKIWSDNEKMKKGNKSFPILSILDERYIFTRICKLSKNVDKNLYVF